MRSNQSYDHHEAFEAGSSSNYNYGGDHHQSLMTFEGGSSNNVDHALHLHPQLEVSPIGLSLRKSNSLINLVEMTLREQKTPPPPEEKKLKASNFPALLLQIGTWKRISKNEGDLVAKIYYAKKKLVWEFLDGPLKNKIEVQWSEISAIMHQGHHGRLEIELNQPPLFCREINPQPRKHTQWKQTSDFTGGQASICRRHSIIFALGVLDKQYEKLLQCDKRLFTLSRQPFPINNYPFFYQDPNHYLDYSYVNVHHGPPAPYHGDLDSNLLMSGMYETHVRVQDQWSQTEMINEDINPAGYVNGGISSIEELRDNYRIGIQEPTSWMGIPHVYELPRESRMEDFGDSYRNHQYNPY
ncbi:hypothetical protein Hdeb2414_s0040g00735981 [Helianthus debilis subsp. tardiflorus]